MKKVVLIVLVVLTMAFSSEGKTDILWNGTVENLTKGSEGRLPSGLSLLDDHTYILFGDMAYAIQVDKLRKILTGFLELTIKNTYVDVKFTKELEVLNNVVALKTKSEGIMLVKIHFRYIKTPKKTPVLSIQAFDSTGFEKTHILLDMAQVILFLGVTDAKDVEAKKRHSTLRSLSKEERIEWLKE